MMRNALHSPKQLQASSARGRTLTEKRTVTRSSRSRLTRVRLAALVAASAAVMAVAAPATAAPGSQSPEHSAVRGAMQASADPWGTRVGLDANCVSNSLEHRVAFALFADDSVFTRRYVMLVNGSTDPSDSRWFFFDPNQAPGEAPPLTGWTNGTSGPYTRVFGFAARPEAQGFRRYAVGYQVLLQDGSWSDMYVVEASYQQDGTPTSGGCTTGR